MRRGFIYFLRAFTFTGILNVLPQLFLITYFPSHRAVMLPVFLMLYSACGAFGLWWSRKMLGKSHGWLPASYRLREGLLLAIVLVMNLALLALFKVHHWSQFLLSLVILAVSLEASFNWLDHVCTERMPEGELGRHAARASIAQLLGVCLAPLAFTLGYGGASDTWLLPMACVVFVGLSYWSLSSSIVSRGEFAKSIGVQAKGVPEAKRNIQGNVRGSRLQPIDIMFLLFVLFTYCSAFLFASYGIFLLKDYYHLAHAITDGGWMFTVMNLSSIIGAAVYGSRLSRNGKRVSLRGGASATGVLLLAIALFAMRLNFHLYFIFALASLAGVPYGCFLVMSRDYASTRTTITRNHVLSLYNMSGNAASITAFLVSLVVTVILKGHSAAAYLPVLLLLIILFLVMALVALYGFSLELQHIEDKKVVMS